MTWNPRTPDEIGLPWFAAKEPSTPLDGEYVAACAVLDSEVSETIGSVWVFCSADATSTPLEDGWELEVYDTGNLDGGAVTETVFRPSADAWNVDLSGWDGASTVTSNLYALIDESANTPDTYGTPSRPVWDGDWISPTFGQAAEGTFYFGSVQGTFTTEQILTVKLRAYAQELISLAFVSGAPITPYLRYNGNRYLGDPVMVSGDAADYQLVEHTWESCPWTRAAWKISDVEDFDQLVGVAEAGWIIGATGSSNNTVVIYRGELVVEAAERDPRVIVGSLTDTDRTGWVEIPLLNKVTGATANWSKLAGARYLLVLRRRTGTGFVWWRALDSGESMPHCWQSGRPQVDRKLRLVGLSDGNLAQFGDLDRTPAYAVLLEKSTGGFSVDSQPYVSEGGDTSGRLGFDQDWPAVWTGQTLEQRITTPGGDRAYPFVQAMLAVESPDTTADLTITLRAASAPNTVIATCTVSPSELEDPTNRFQRFGAFWDSGTSPTLTGSTQYLVRFASTAARDEGWRVQVLSTSLLTNPGGPPSGVEDVTAGGGSGLLKVNNATYGTLDAAVTLHTTPTAPSNFLAAEAGEVECIDWVELTWTATALGDDFLRYEIERSSDAGATWECVARVTSEATAAYDDYLAPRNEQSLYRLRVVRQDRSPSAWTASQAATPTMECCGWVFAHNDHPSLVQWYDGFGEHAWEFLENVETIQLHGRDYQVAVRELEDRGDRWKASLLIAAVNGAATPVAQPSATGRQAFDDLLVLCGNKRDRTTGDKVTVDYVAVLDKDGNRWLASIETPSGVRQEGDLYVLDIVVTEVAAEPPCTDDPIVIEGS